MPEKTASNSPSICFDVLQEGWLAVGNAHGVVGVSFTSTRSFDYCFGDSDDDPLGPANYADGDWRRSLPGRTNYNLRGHRAEITLVRWNEPFQKLATCDESGVIFIWIKYEGRWSVELINDRSARVTDMAWSSDGRLAVICYVDGFVLVGSVTGQRYWSSMLNLNEGHVTCCVWSGDDQNILFSTSSGHVLVISAHGQYITQVSVQACVPICGLAWTWPHDYNGNRLPGWNNGLGSSLAVAFSDGVICLLNNYDDPMPEMIRTELSGLRMCWSSNGNVLAVGGHCTRAFGRTQGATTLFKNSTFIRYDHMNVVQLYSRCGNLQCRMKLDYDQAPLTTLVFGNDDSRLYVACGKLLLVGWVTHQVPSLAHLARIKAHQLITKRQLRPKRLLLNIDLPWPVRGAIHEVLTPTICCHLPDYSRIREFVFRPPPHNIRLYCTLIRHNTSIVEPLKSNRPSSSSTNSRSATPISALADDESIYVLYLEYLGGLVPILKGKRSSKLKTEFVIYDPVNSVDGERIDIHNHDFDATESSASSRVVSLSATSDEDNNVSEDEDTYGRSSSLAFSFLTPKTRRRLLHLRSAQIRRFFRPDRQDNERSTNSATPTRRRLRNARGLFDTDDDEDDDSADESFRSPYTQQIYRPGSAQRFSQLDSNQNFLSKKSQTRTSMKSTKRPLKIVCVRSNIWGTKFKFLSVSPMLPSRLGSMNYRTSFLHLQPRQMALTIKEMHEQNTTLQPPTETGSYIKTGNGTGFHSNITSDSEDTSDSDFSLCESDLDSQQPTPAIVPMSPPKYVRNSMLLSFPQSSNSILSNRQISISGSSSLTMPPVNRQTIPAAEEFLTLAIAEPALPGNSPQYSMEMSTVKDSNTRQEPPEVITKSSENSPKQQLCQSVPSSSMVRQFKHQTFHSESPKHVRKQREPLSVSTSSSKKGRTTEHSHSSDATNRPFCTEIRTKILKESPSRKASSIVACSSADFSPTKPTAAYKPEPEVESVVKVPISALGEMKTVCQMFEETCAIVAHTTSNTASATNSVGPLTTNGTTTISSSTSLILDSEVEESQGAQIRRRQFQQQSSKSYEIQAPSNDLITTFETNVLESDRNSPQLHLNNIEHAVKVLSEKLNSSNHEVVGKNSKQRQQAHALHQATSSRQRSSSVDLSAQILSPNVGGQNSPAATAASTAANTSQNNALNQQQTQSRKSLGLHLFKSPMMVRKMMRRK